MNDEELVAEALARLHEAGSKEGEGQEVNEVQEEGTQSPKKRGRKPKRQEPKFPVEPQVIQVRKFHRLPTAERERAREVINCIK
jgi:hypothetical protein